MKLFILVLFLLNFSYGKSIFELMHQEWLQYKVNLNDDQINVPIKKE